MLSPFEIHEAHTVEEASHLLAEHGPESAVYAGGTELLVLMKERVVHFPHLVNIKTIPGLDAISLDTAGYALQIGPLATLRAIERSPLVREQTPLLAEMASHVANLRVRSAGTIGGNLCFAEPHSDPATLLIAWNATFTLTSTTGSRQIAAADFFLGLFETARRHDEILTGIQIPLPSPPTGSAYERFKTHERPTATVATVVRVEDGEIAEARVVVGAVGSRPIRISGAETLLCGQLPSPDLFVAAAQHAHDEIDPTEDAFESTDYKRHIVRVLTARALAVAANRSVVGEGPVPSHRPQADSLVHWRFIPHAENLWCCAPREGTGPSPTDDGRRAPLRMVLNSRPVEIEIEPREILLDVLRDRLGLTGAKRSCDLQVCGACTVLLDGNPVSSCCTLAYEARGRSVTTIEALAQYGDLHPIQTAFIRNVAIQCGFCTPGMILTTKALLAENPHPTRAEIQHALAGNLCRCTGYWNIIAAVEDTARLMATTTIIPSDATFVIPSEVEGSAGHEQAAIQRQIPRQAQDDDKGGGS